MTQVLAVLSMRCRRERRPGSTAPRCACAGRRGRPCRRGRPAACTCAIGLEAALRMSSSRVQISLTGVPGICLAMRTALRDVVLERRAGRSRRPGAACRPRTWRRQAGGLRRSGQRRFAVLRGDPDLALFRRPLRRAVHRLHAGVVLEGGAVDGLDLLGRAGDRLRGVAGLVADEHAVLGRRAPPAGTPRWSRSRPCRWGLPPR